MSVLTNPFELNGTPAKQRWSFCRNQQKRLWRFKGPLSCHLCPETEWESLSELRNHPRPPEAPRRVRTLRHTSWQRSAARVRFSLSCRASGAPRVPAVFSEGSCSRGHLGVVRSQPSTFPGAPLPGSWGGGLKGLWMGRKVLACWLERAAPGNF